MSDCPGPNGIAGALSPALQSSFFRCRRRRQSLVALSRLISTGIPTLCERDAHAAVL